MKTLVAMLTVGTLALTGCGHGSDTSTSTTITNSTSTTTTVIAGDGWPADCQTYFARVDELATRMGGPMAAQYRDAMARSRQQYENMPNKDAAAPGCRAALAALDQQSAIMNQMGQH